MSHSNVISIRVWGDYACCRGRSENVALGGRIV